MYKLIIFIIMCCILSALLKQYCKELVLPFNMIFSIFALIYIFNSVSNQISYAKNYLSLMDADTGIISALIKAACISTASKLTSDFCKESGNFLMQSIVELAGRLFIFYISSPYIIKLIRLSVSLLK